VRFSKVKINDDGVFHLRRGSVGRWRHSHTHTQHPSIAGAVSVAFCSGATAWPRGLAGGGVLGASLPARPAQRPPPNRPSDTDPFRKYYFRPRVKIFASLCAPAFVLSRALFKQHRESVEHRREGTYTLQKESSPEGAAANLAESPHSPANPPTQSGIPLRWMRRMKVGRPPHS
jgi:hypothetical protein